METPDVIKKSIEHCAGSRPCAECAYDNKDFPYCIMRQRTDALAYIQKLEAQVPRWISVQERLPDKSHDWVLIIGKWVPEGGWTVPHVAEYREGVWLINGTGWNKIEDLHVKVTHWMPLPEPPKEEGFNYET